MCSNMKIHIHKVQNLFHPLHQISGKTAMPSFIHLCSSCFQEETQKPPSSSVVSPSISLPSHFAMPHLSQMSHMQVREIMPPIIAERLYIRSVEVPTYRLLVHVLMLCYILLIYLENVNFWMKYWCRHFILSVLLILPFIPSTVYLRNRVQRCECLWLLFTFQPLWI